MPRHKVILFYKFVNIRNPEKLVREQKELCSKLNLKGRMLVAEEGVNATFEGKVRDINKYKRLLTGKKMFKNLAFKESEGTGYAFTRLEVKVRKEVVTLNAGKFDVKRETAKTITPKELERMYKKDEDFAVLDLRNDFEIDVGYFEKTINSEIGFSLSNFRELKDKVSALKPIMEKKLVAVCTGGIRCEKATCLLKKEGFKNIFQLKDGIHAYMQEYPGKRFKGSLFVFDNRMTTSVKDSPKREVVGRCVYCSKKCEEYYSNDTVRPSRKVICCISCAKKHRNELRRCMPA